MTIKQQGGIFGRNPTFNNVTADQINSNGAVIAAGAGSFGDDVDINGDIILANGKGIDFSATSGTGTSELFDDYEEGTWTPAYNTTNDNLTVTHDVRVGYYTKVGNLVTCTGRLRTDAVSGGTGQVQIHGLPFAAKNVVIEGSVGSLTTTLATSFVTPPSAGYLRESTTFAELMKNDGADVYAVADLSTGANSNALYFSLTYLTD